MPECQLNRITRYRLHGYETIASHSIDCHSESTEKETQPGLWRQPIRAEEVLDARKKKNESNFQIICNSVCTAAAAQVLDMPCSSCCAQNIEHRYCTSTNCVCVCTQSHNTANVFTSLNLNSSFQYTRYACTHDAARCKTLNVVVLAGLSTAAEFEKKTCRCHA